MENPFKKLGEEWKKASPKEKLFIVGAAASIIAVALYLHNKTSSIGGTGTTGLPGNFQPGTGATGSSTGSTGTTGTTGTTGLGITPSFLGPPTPGPGTTGTISTIGTTGTGTGTTGTITPVHVVSNPQDILSPHPVRFLGPPQLNGTATVPWKPPRFLGPPVTAAPPKAPYATPVSGVVPYRGVWQQPSGLVNSLNATTLQSGVQAGQHAVLQPTATTQVYSNIRHSPAPAPARTFQAAAAAPAAAAPPPPPAPVRRSRAV